VAIITERHRSIFVVAYCGENTVAADGYCIAGAIALLEEDGFENREPCSV
jgi:hypothetical protein